MKNSSLFSILIVSAAVLVSGCHHKPSSVTPIPENMQPPQNNDQSTSGGTVPGGDNTTSVNSNGTIPLGNGPYSALINGPHNEDREKFKADAVYFDFDSAVIKPSEESKLQDVASYFKGNSTDALAVEGNCDERGTAKYNLSLGERRALAAREYLANLGVDPQRIKTITYGASRPVDPGHNEAAWKKNRRDDFILITPVNH